MQETIVIPRRFRGPPSSANGGYAAGLLASFLDGPAEVTLRRPPPLERELGVERRGAAAVLLDGAVLVAEAVPAVVDVAPPEIVSLDAAAAAAQRSPVLEHPEWHPFPGCFVCGPDRAPGDGMRVFPGHVAGTGVFAAPVSFPDAVSTVLVWAALDCPSSYVMYLGGARPESAYVLGRIAARIDRLPDAGEPVVAVSWRLGAEGRKLFSASALLDATGTVCAAARATWISV